MGHQEQNRRGSKATQEINSYNSVKYLVLQGICIFLCEHEHSPVSNSVFF